MLADLRVCFLGDSFVAGVGDPEHLGWSRRIAAWTEQAGQRLTAYGLGVRRETSTDVLERWAGECRARWPAGCDARAVVSFGVNDTTVEGGVRRVAPQTSAANLRSLIDQLEASGVPVLVVGPPPVADRAQTERIAALDGELAAVCRGAVVGFVSVVADLEADRTWRGEVTLGDGAHPGAAGYRRLAELVWPAWCSWLGLGVQPAATTSMTGLMAASSGSSPGTVSSGWSWSSAISDADDVEAAQGVHGAVEVVEVEPVGDALWRRASRSSGWP